MKALHFFRVIPLLICLFVSSCGPSSTAITVVKHTQTDSPTILGQSTSDPTLLRMRFSTTSDWTDLFFVSGATWLSHDLVSASVEATLAEVFDGHLVLSQQIDRAESGESVEMLVDVNFFLVDSRESLLFKVERGDVGTTSVEFSVYKGEEWVIIKTIEWGGTSGDGNNPHSFEIPIKDITEEVTFPTQIQPNSGITVETPVPLMHLGTEAYPWWNDSIFYEIYVRSFCDSDGDGIGDLNGITQKLDYLNDGDPETSTDLGISGIWLMPIYPSPSVHGYNVTDFYAVNSDYGTMDDLKNLVTEAHTRGIRVILDMTLNHTSTQHPWFVQGTNPSSPYHDWYIWSDEDPGYNGSWGQQVWFPSDGRFFYSTFSANFADLNYNNPKVWEEMQNVIRFWLDEAGVDGFRLDAAKHMIEEGTIQANSLLTHAWWKNFHTFFKQVNPDALAVGEIWDSTALTADYLEGDELDLSFDFYLADRFIQSVNEGNSTAARDQIELSYTSVPSLKFAPFLTNHDLNRAISQFGDNPEKAKVAAALMLTAPGTPFLYYGEEIGLQGDVPGDENRRPMQWSTGINSGFSSGTPWKPVGPGWEVYNVDAETEDPVSILSHYRNLIQARNQHAALRVGDMSMVTTGNDALYSFLRVSTEEAVLILVNLTEETVKDYRLESPFSNLDEGVYIPVSDIRKDKFATMTVNSVGGFTQYIPIPEIPAYAIFILQLQLNTP